MRKFFGPMGSVSRLIIESDVLRGNILGDSMARAVDVRRAEPVAAGPDGQPDPARVLALDGQQPLGNLFGAARGRTGQQLRGSPLGGDSSFARSEATLSCGDASWGR